MTALLGVALALSVLGSDCLPQEPEPTPAPAGRTIMARVTGYSYESCSNPRCLTRSGVPARWGGVAVDPQVIPLGSRMLIDGFGDQVFVAIDTGGGVRGNHVDVWFWSTREALNWGVRTRQVWILED